VLIQVLVNAEFVEGIALVEGLMVRILNRRELSLRSARTPRTARVHADVADADED